MSTERGNASRTRPQKHQNKFKFKNNLHDTSHTTKFINNLEIVNVCSKCKGIIDWKIKFKKYKPLKAPSTCVKCKNKNVKFAYHTICSECAKEHQVCPKCGEAKELVQKPQDLKSEDLLQNNEIQEMIKELPERRRRTFNRFMKKNTVTSETEVLEKLKELSLNTGGSSLGDFDESDFDDDCD